MSEEKNLYRIFDGDEDEFTLKAPTNANIRDICRIATQAMYKTNEERIYYAQDGDIPPSSYDEDNHPVYTFKNIYMQGSFWPALAQVLFYDCPQLIELKDDKPVIAEPDLCESLDRGEVRRAFNTFLGKFGSTPYEVRSLLNAWDTAQIRGIMQKLHEMDRLGNSQTHSTPGDQES